MAQKVVNNQNEREKIEINKNIILYELSSVCCKRSKTDYRIKFINLKI